MLNTKELLRRLNDAGVQYVVIGGIAAVAHGSPVATDDLDLCAPLDHDNAVRIATAFRGLEPRWRQRPDLPVVTPNDPLLGKLKNIYLRTTLGVVDVLGEIPGVCSCSEVLERSVEMDIAGVKTRVIDVNLLISAKLAAGRPHDHQTVAYLRAIHGDKG